jgi:hypothetical protein
LRKPDWLAPHDCSGLNSASPPDRLSAAAKHFALGWRDDQGSGVEVYPAGTELQPAGEEGGSFVRKPREGRGFGATHVALSVAADAGKVKQIAERAGWHCVTCNTA